MGLFAIEGHNRVTIYAPARPLALEGQQTLDTTIVTQDTSVDVDTTRKEGDEPVRRFLYAPGRFLRDSYDCFGESRERADSLRDWRHLQYFTPREKPIRHSRARVTPLEIWAGWTVRHITSASRTKVQLARVPILFWGRRSQA